MDFFFFLISIRIFRRVPICAPEVCWNTKLLSPVPHTLCHVTFPPSTPGIPKKKNYIHLYNVIYKRLLYHIMHAFFFIRTHETASRKSLVIYMRYRALV